MWRKSDKWLPSYAQKAILGYLPQIYVLGPQPPCETKFSKNRNCEVVYHKIMNKLTGCLQKSD